MQSVINEFRRWFPSQEGGCGEGGGVMVRRGSKGKGDEEGRSKVKDAVRRLDNIKIGTSPQGMKGAVRIPGLSADTNTDDDPEVQLKRPNNLPSLSDSGPYGRKENVMVLPSLSPESDKQQNKLGQENHGILKLSESWGKGEAQKGKECSVTKPAVLPRPPLVNNAANGAHCPAGPSPHSVTLSERDVDPVIDTQAPGSTSLGDKHRQPASESSRLKLNPREDRQHRSLSFPQRLLTASPSTTTATSTATATTAATKGKSLPAKLNPKDFNEKTISRWKKEHLVSTLARALMKRPDDVPASSTLCPPSPKYFSACTTPVPASPTSASPPDVPDFPSSAAAFPTSSSTNSSILPDSRSSFADSFISITDSQTLCPNTTSLVADTSSPLIDAPTPVSDPSPDVPDTSKWKITNKLSLRRVSNTILNTVAQLFAQFLPKPSPSKTLLLSSTSSGEKVQEVAQEEAGDIVMRRKPSRSRDVKIEEEEDDDFVDVDMKRRLSSKETHRKVYVYEEDATHVFAPRDTLTQSANRVRDIVRMIEDGMKNNADTAKQADTVIRKLGSEVLHNMRLPLNNPMEWNDDGKQSPENKPIKEEISKGDGGGGGGVGGVNQQDANSLITQSPTSGMKENEDQTGIEESDKEAEWKLFAALQGTSFRSKRRNSEIKIGGEGKRKSEKEKEDEENEKGRGDKQRSQEKNENGDRQEDSEKISEEGQRDNEENEKQEIKIVVDEEETESDTDEENVIMRSRPRERPMPFYRYSTLGPRVRLPQNTIYPFCVVRPRTVIISLG
ncbi:hypothetical protein E2C01_014409 [Portunus trituberculatus]|uniref:Uncharacterized protein n=1 Tax=Portunus trituberculatus TaxID=210409 RepID=A0A5B7DJX1_PORTR|nr:hypothetical protein [Portunus trituberculatus]